jgi:glycosyltransferase involved in cell wall biosynthesis
LLEHIAGQIKAGTALTKISLIVSTKGRTAEVERLFRSLVDQDYTSFEIIVVDQNPDDRLEDLFAKPWPFPAQRVHVPHERGVSRGRNIGWPLATGDIVTFPDDDCWYPPWFLARAVATLDATGADIVGGRAADQTGRSINGRFEMTPQRVDRRNVWTTQIEWVVFFRKTVLESVGGYDVDIGVGASSPWQAGEGQDIMLRALAKGFRSSYDPDLYAHHDEHTIGPHNRAMVPKGRAYGRGMGYVLRRHDFGLPSVVNWVARPALLAAFNLARAQPIHAKYYLNVSIGRLEGWMMRTVS